MEVLDPGHAYSLTIYDNEITQRGPMYLHFMKRKGSGYPGNKTSYPGTNCQEVIRVLMDRIKYLDKQIPHNNNLMMLNNLMDCLYLLEQRAAERHDLNLIGIPLSTIDTCPTCPICGHIRCKHDVGKNK